MSVTLTWDGAVTTPNYNEYYCRVSERIFTKDELLGGSVVFGGNEYMITDGMVHVVEGVGIIVYTTDNVVASDPVLVTGTSGAYTHPGALGGTFSIPADGTYFVRQYDTDGDYTASLHLPNAASDPVPVSPVQLNPAALMQSFFVGEAVKRMRK